MDDERQHLGQFELSRRYGIWGDHRLDPGASFGITSSQVATGTVTFGLVLPRLNDPTALLAENWAQRQAVLNGLTPAQVGAMYGADPAQYAALNSYLSTVPGATVLGAAQGYVSSAQSRTVWVKLDAQAFQTLFGQELKSSNGVPAYWDGNLTPNASLGNLAGLWPGSLTAPSATAQYTSGVTLQEGPQGVGNTSGGGYQQGVANSVQTLFPNQIATEYNFPLAGSNVTTPTIGLVEPGVGAAVPQGDNADDLIQAYRAKAGVSGTGTISNGPVQAAATTDTSGERSLDVGIVATAAPNSDIVTVDGANDTYTALEEAIWGGGPKLADLSSSIGVGNPTSPNSPFAAALHELNEDAALNNISVFFSAGDGGSSAEKATGSVSSRADPLHITVGGTSTSSQAQVEAAGSANTGGAANINAGIAALAQRAQSGDVASLETLVAGGLTQKPTASTNISNFLQTTWNQYDYDASTQTLNSGYNSNYAGAGGVNTMVPEPSYQLDAGIDTQALAQAAGIPNAAPGKGDPDVSALAGGNSSYTVPQGDLTSSTLTQNGGTSASSPLWAALTAKIQAVFADQGLPTTGYFNDLLYTAATVDPGSFNDVQFGSDTSSFYYDPSGTVHLTDGSTITPTGLGYSAGPGYDLATGLGTPNGILLARALTQVAQAEIYSPNAVPVTDATGTTSAAKQVLIVQPTLTANFSGSVGVAGTAFTPASDGSGLGWSARIAQQTLQSSFDPQLSQAIAGQAQASSTQVSVANGQSLDVSIGGAAAAPNAQADTSAFGFVTYDSGGQSVTLARPLAVAETYGGQNDTTAIVRIRQESTDSDALSFYRVDDLSGSIDGIAPGQAGYAAAAAARSYTSAGGTSAIDAPGDGQFLQTSISGVNNGDIIGFELTDATSGQTSWGLATQNAGGANRIWSYGANTWGIDDGSVAGDAFDSTVFQLDFTGAAGSGLLVSDNPPVCFVAGTRIGTPSGSKSVEHLAIGDLIVTSSGMHKAIRWLGHRAIDCRRHPRPHEAMPVRISAHAFGPGLPARDLALSQGHPVLVGADDEGNGGHLVPIMCLINGTTVHRVAVDAVTYWHVELDQHDILLAEGLPAESYIDLGSRPWFAGADGALHDPDMAPPGMAGRCRPVAVDGPVVEAERRRLDMVFAARLAAAAAWPSVPWPLCGDWNIQA